MPIEPVKKPKAVLRTSEAIRRRSRPSTRRACEGARRWRAVDFRSDPPGLRRQDRTVRSTAVYGLWIAVVAAVMVLLPLIYVSIIGLLVAGLVYHARSMTSRFSRRSVAGSMH